MSKSISDELEQKIRVYMSGMGITAGHDEPDGVFPVEVAKFSKDLAKQLAPVIERERVEATDKVIAQLKPFIDELEAIKSAEQSEAEGKAFAKAVDKVFAQLRKEQE